MVIIAILILVLYYYFFVSFEKRIEKPQNLSKPVVNLNNKLSNGVQIKSDHYYDYDSNAIKGPFEYSIQFDKTKKEILFTVHDNDFTDQQWVLPLTMHYYWEDEKIVETDSCFNIPNHSNVKAKGKMLYNYIQNNNLITDPQHMGTLSKKIFHSDRLFYFKCNNNKIESLHSCPPGTLLNNQIKCETIHSCTGKMNNYLYPDENSKFKYFRCFNEKPQPMTCPKGEIFQYDQCIVPENLCEIRSDGFLQDVDRKSFLMCLNGKSVLHYCPPYTYALNGHCEREVCENKQNDFVPIIIDDGAFEMASKYGKCVKGRLIETLDCPNAWNDWETDVNILHLPQVFDSNLNACTKPKLCENVKITDPDIIVPQYAYSKYLKNWGLAPIFDLITGYRCDHSGNRIQETLPPGELIINFRKTKISSQTAGKIPTSDETKYFNVLNNTLESCPAGYFFDGNECKKKNPNAFTFRHLDIFEFDGLYMNGWMKASVIDNSNKNTSCTGDFIPMDTVKACVHKDCAHLQFLYQLKSSIKLDEKYECVRNRNRNRIEKMEYQNPYNLRLEFWNQRLARDPQDLCTFGTKIKTGNFVLDSTVFMTCNPHQPFVFCPSNLTETIQNIGNIHACIPKQTVYQMEIPKNINVLLYKNEISGISISNTANVTIDNVQQYIPNARFLTVTEIVQHFNITQVFFYFMCDEPVRIQFTKLPTHPENVYLENGILKLNAVGIFNIIHDRQVRYIKPHQYKLKESVTDFKY